MHTTLEASLPRVTNVSHIKRQRSVDNGQAYTKVHDPPVKESTLIRTPAPITTQIRQGGNPTYLLSICLLNTLYQKECQELK